MKHKILLEKTCIMCNAKFYVIPCRTNQKCCSPKCFAQRCRERFSKPKVKLNCLYCNQIFEVKPYQKTIRKFCSASCASSYNQKDGSWNKGIAHTDEEKRKIGEGVIKSRPSNWINPSTRTEVKAKISATMLKNGTTKQEQNANWRGGISFEPYSFEWTKELKENIRQRDNHECQICYIKQKDYFRALDVHHIDQNKKNCNEDNLITLCNSCHIKLHGKSICLKS